MRLTFDNANAARQTLQSTVSKVLLGLHRAQSSLRQGFTAERDLATMPGDPIAEVSAVCAHERASVSAPA